MEFINTFVSLTAQRNNRNMIPCVCPFNYTAIFKEIKIIILPALATRFWEKNDACTLEQGTQDAPPPLGRLGHRHGEGSGPRKRLVGGEEG